MPTSRHRTKHKEKSRARTKKIHARREQAKNLVQQLEQEFTKLDPRPNDQLEIVKTPGVFLTPTPDEYQIHQI